MGNTPSISVIMVTEHAFESCRRTIGYLRKQTIVDKIELVLVGPSREVMCVDEAYLEPFQSFQIVEAGEVTMTGAALAEGVHAATSPYVTYAEEHVYPPEELIETIFKKLDEGYYGVGWTILNANPGLISWAHMCLQFSAAVGPIPAGEAPRLVGHHAGYRRDMLLSYGDGLVDVLNAENVLSMNLHKNGYKQYMCGDIGSGHVNISSFTSLIQQEFYGLRGFAGSRVDTENWPWAKRIVYALGAPLIPFKRTSAAIGALRRDPARSQAMIPQIVPIMFLAAYSGALGEAAGYLFGGKEAAHKKLLDFETDRFSHVAEGDNAPRMASEN